MVAVSTVTIGVFYAAFCEASGLITNFPEFLAFLVIEQVAGFIRVSVGTEFPAIPAPNLRACVIDVALSDIAACETLVTDGAVVTPDMLDRLPPGARGFDRYTCVGGGRESRRHKRDGGMGRTGVDVRVVLERKIAITPRGALGETWATTMEISTGASQEGQHARRTSGY